MSSGRIDPVRACERRILDPGDPDVTESHPAGTRPKTPGAASRWASGLSHRFRLLVVTMIGATACLGVPWIHPPTRLVYNASSSVPLGWYVQLPASRISVGTFVVARLPPAAARLAADRGYLPITVPIIKLIGADAGERVCERSRVLSVDGRPVARALVADSEGRPLPAWSGCEYLAHNQYLLLGDGALDSYDSRYFGPVGISAILGRAIPLWTWR